MDLAVEGLKALFQAVVYNHTRRLWHVPTPEMLVWTVKVRH